ncbi:hypothetical protein N431DRAFT_510776 [Stipitochalara longipes BDJ]|nr:hypothetical protein N431DRAFT_510776 [Stipitochalara longipes BDJ]
MEYTSQHSKPSSLLATLLTAVRINQWPFHRLKSWSRIRLNRTAQSKTPKAIAKCSRRGNIGIYLIHLLPIAATCVLFFLNFSNKFFELPGIPNQNARLNAIQFAAKLHEVSITLSLSAIILNHIQYQLLNGRGVPIGTLFAPFQISNLSSLYSPGLWMTGYTNDSRLYPFLHMIIIVISIVLASIVGPASAILMMPSLGYWNQPFNFPYSVTDHTNNTTTRYFVKNSVSNLWPSLLSNTSSYPDDCNSTASPMPVYCPLGGFSMLVDLATPSWYMNADSRWNFTIQSPSSQTAVYNQYIEGRIVNDEEGFIPFTGADDSELLTGTAFVSGTASLFTGNFLVSLFDMLAVMSPPPPLDDDGSKLSLVKPGGEVLAPAVYSTTQWRHSCLTSLKSRSPLQQDSPQNWSSDASSLIDTWSNSTRTATQWFEPPDLGNNTPSIGIAWAAFADATTAIISSCSVYASWQPIDIYINMFEGNFIHSATIDKSISTMEQSDYLLLYSKRPIKVDPGWASSALPPNGTVGEIIRRTSLPYGPATNNVLDINTNGLGVSVSIFLADVISRVGAQSLLLLGEDVSNKTGVFMEYLDLRADSSLYMFSYYQVPSDFRWIEAGKSDYAEFQFTLQIYGYSYSMQGLTRRIAAGILLMHVLIAVIYMVLLRLFGWRCYGLRSLVEIVVLAISSPRSKALDGSLGWRVEGKDIYRSVLQVKEVANRRLGFVFDGDGHGGERVVLGKRYESLGSLEGFDVDRIEKKSDAREEIREVEVRSRNASEASEA